MKNKFVTIAACILGLGLLSTSASALLFDPDDSGPDAPIDVATFDWLPGSSVGIGAIPIPAAPATTNFQLLSHSSLGSFVDASGNAIGGTGLNTNYELTYVLGFRETATSNSPGSATFQFAPGAANFFEIYFDPGQDSAQAAGTGFNNGTLILSGNITNAVGSFILDPNAPPVSPLDQSANGDQRPGEGTVTGAGGTLLGVTVDITSLDPTFFTSNPDTLTLSFNTSQVLPFGEVDPSQNFVPGPGGVAPMPAAGIAGVGGVNGATGTSILLQSDANNSFAETNVPEPTTLLLLGAGLVGFGLTGRKKYKTI